MTIRKERVLTHAGMRIIDKPILTKVMGQDNISFKCDRTTIQIGGILILATDGFYEARKAIFNHIIIEFAEAQNINEEFSVLTGKLEMFRGDDLTGVVIKQN